jgi:hypothetical protein
MEALENIGKLIQRLNVAHISFKPDWELEGILKDLVKEEARDTVI